MKWRFFTYHLQHALKLRCHSASCVSPLFSLNAIRYVTKSTPVCISVGTISKPSYFWDVYYTEDLNHAVYYAVKEMFSFARGKTRNVDWASFTPETTATAQSVSGHEEWKLDQVPLIRKIGLIQCHRRSSRVSLYKSECWIYGPCREGQTAINLINRAKTISILMVHVAVHH